MKTTTLKTKRGAASLYIVTFITLLLGIISLSFVRVMVSSSARSNNTDLAQSALDSAQAGVEDARVALLAYHDCISNPSKQGCTALVQNAEKDIQNEDCDTVQHILSRQKGTDDEVIIQETKNSSSTNSDDMLQAYTCVKIQEEIDDYRTTLNDDSRNRIVPIRVGTYTEGGQTHSLLEKLDTITISWYSDVNKKSNASYGRTDGKMTTSASDVPTIAVQLFQTNDTFTIGELSVPNNSVNGTDHATAYLNPQSPASGNGITEINASTFTKTNTKSPDQRYFNVKCTEIGQMLAGANSEFACSVKIKVPKAFRVSDPKDIGSVFLYLIMPYGGSDTDVSVQLKQSNGNIIKFLGVQALVDSTGRANDLYRRLETRLELVDIYYPYPENAIELSDYNKTLKKHVKIARECWYTVAKTGNRVTVVPCPAVTNN